MTEQEQILDLVTALELARVQVMMVILLLVIIILVAIMVTTVAMATRETVEVFSLKANCLVAVLPTLSRIRMIRRRQKQQKKPKQRAF